MSIFTIKLVHLNLVLFISDTNQKIVKEAMDIDLHVNQFQQQKQMHRPRIYKVRDNPIETMNDIDFKRFTKEHVLKLTELKAEDLISDSNRGLPGVETKPPKCFGVEKCLMNWCPSCS